MGRVTGTSIKSADQHTHPLYCRFGQSRLGACVRHCEPPLPRGDSLPYSFESAELANERVHATLSPPLLREDSVGCIFVRRLRRACPCDTFTSFAKGGLIERRGVPSWPSNASRQVSGGLLCVMHWNGPPLSKTGPWENRGQVVVRVQGAPPQPL